MRARFFLGSGSLAILFMLNIDKNIQENYFLNQYFCNHTKEIETNTIFMKIHLKNKKTMLGCIFCVLLSFNSFSQSHYIIIIDRINNTQIFKKKQFDKERVPVWSDYKYKVIKIDQSHGQNFYHVEGLERPYLRHEILLQR
jgi:hypothetical protein